MENYISYSAGGKCFKFKTQLTLGNRTNEQNAIKVFLEVANDRDTRLLKGEIPKSLEKTSDISAIENYITKIEYVDYSCNKKLSMNRMSDIWRNFKIDTL